MSAQRILSVDIGTTFGWSLIFEGAPVEIGEWSVKIKSTENLADTQRRLRQWKWLLEKIDLYSITHVAVELVNPATIRGGRQMSLYYGALGVIELIAADRNLPLVYVPVQTAKKILTGRGNAKKPEMVAAAKQKTNLTIPGDNGADALAVGLAALEIINVGVSDARGSNRKSGSRKGRGGKAAGEGIQSPPRSVRGSPKARAGALGDSAR